MPYFPQIIEHLKVFLAPTGSEDQLKLQIQSIGKDRLKLQIQSIGKDQLKLQIQSIGKDQLKLQIQSIGKLCMRGPTQTTDTVYR